MSTVNYSLKHKGVRLISADKAWVQGKKWKSKIKPHEVFNLYMANL